MMNVTVTGDVYTETSQHVIYICYDLEPIHQLLLESNKQKLVGTQQREAIHVVERQYNKADVILVNMYARVRLDRPNSMSPRHWFIVPKAFFEF